MCLWSKLLHISAGDVFCCVPKYCAEVSLCCVAIADFAVLLCTLICFVLLKLHLCLCRCRLTNPIEDAEVMKVGSLFGISNLLEHVAKARKQVAGAMFPRHVSN